METRANHILIGLFVLLAFACALLFALWLNKSPGSNADARAYRVIFRESVQGLAEGSPVQYNGIPVGSVTALDLDPDKPNQVLARILVRAATPIRQDTTATLAMQGLAGRSIIQLRGGGADDSPPLSSTDGQDPVIIARPSPLSHIVDQGEQTVTNLNALTQSVQQLLAPTNLAHIEQTLANVARLSATLAAQSDAVGDTLSDARAATRQFQQTFANLDKTIQVFHTSIGARAPRIADNLDKSAASLADILHQTSTLLRDASGSVRRTLQGASAIGPTLAELRVTLAALRAALERLDADPAGYLLNRNPLQEFTP